MNESVFDAHDAAEPTGPRNVLLVRALLPLLRWAAGRRSEYGDEKPLRLPGGLWVHAYQWSYRCYGAGSGQLWKTWHLLVGWRCGHRSIYLGDERDSQ